MTMLDRMRRHKGWLKWSLAIVILAFVILNIPSFLGPGKAGNNDVVASVEGREITVGRFRQAYQRQMQAYRAQFGGNVDEKMLKLSPGVTVFVPRGTPHSFLCVGPEVGRQLIISSPGGIFDQR